MPAHLSARQMLWIGFVLTVAGLLCRLLLGTILLRTFQPPSVSGEIIQFIGFAFRELFFYGGVVLMASSFLAKKIEALSKERAE